MTVANIENAGSLPERMRFAHALAGSNLLPRTYQQSPANVLVAMELGNALGIAPIVAINEVNVINGAPSLSASLMVALARQSGHKVRTTGDAESATTVIIRADDPDFEHSATWDVNKAKAAGLWGKGHWAKDPATMLKWRSISECVRMACSEVLAGIKYTPDEVAESSGTTHTVTFSTPEPEPVHPPVVPTDQPVPMISEAQLKMIGAAMRDLGMTNRDEALAWIHSVIGKEISSRNDLTKREASLVIDHLMKAQKDSARPDTGEVVQAEVLSEDPWAVKE